MKPVHIESEQALAKLNDELLKEAFVAVDTEFFRETTYYPRLGLVQIASANHIACVDPLAFDARAQLARLMQEPRTTKVFHACMQDMEVLYQYLGQLPDPVVDTQIAAALLGEQDQIGYANLVNHRLGVQLDKSETRTNWLKRPLTEKQIQYALDDVRFLLPLHETLIAELKSQKRETWFETECRELSQSSDRFNPDLNNCWKRVKGSSKAGGVELVIIDAVARWREQCAMEKDLTRRKVIADALVTDIATRRASSPEALSAVNQLAMMLSNNEIQSLSEAISQAINSDPATWPVNNQYRLTADEKTQLKTVLDRLKSRAGKLGIAPSILCSRKEAERLIKGERDLPVLQNWRLDIIGNELLALTDA